MWVSLRRRERTSEPEFREGADSGEAPDREGARAEVQTCEPGADLPQPLELGRTSRDRGAD